MAATERQRRWRRENRTSAESTRRAYAGKPEVKQRRRDQWRAKNPPPPAREELPAWRDRRFAQYLLLRCRSTAKRKGLPFDLTTEFVEELVAPMKCSATGADLVIAPAGQRHPLLPSIDQIRPGEGYLRSNVRVVSWIYNRAKGTGTDEDVLLMALALLQQSVKRQII